ncbi:hypothetical protein FAZ95_15200 [Trinickia violacea]|uniref:Uncharacterized protein n=1 Tax=Trinickia violacea TaxID=2571746 RepID=A0A4P8IQ19_9BURK|nr:hypothetical protein [Trinickia violacea]QCP50396.1 hypothetical protein FAZ95_15200 [Trinickia violacea]
MVRGEMSLGSIFDKWVGRTTDNSVRVTRLGRARSRRYVQVALLRSGTVHTIFFFRHDDGTWNVFPPETERPAMGIAQHAT